MRLTIRPLALLALLLVSACAAAGDSDNPIVRNLGWYDFLDGGDLRKSCQAGEPDLYRFVYNGRWREQVRVYEIRKTPAGDRADLTTRIIFPENLTEIRTDDLLATWRGKTASVPLTASDLAALDRTLAESGFEEPAPKGLMLHSDGTYWVAMACRNGVFHYNAYAYPSERFAALRFPAVLFHFDATGVAVLEPRGGQVDRYYGASRAAQRSGGPVAFDLEVGNNGLRLLRPFL
jgi:hypothetical protein